MIEIWKDVEGYEGLYQVSNLGNVKSLERIIPHRKGNGQRIIKERILKPQLQKIGYYSFNLSKNGKPKLFLAHRLVADAFLEKIDGKECVDHINGCKTDNAFFNLRFVDKKENANNPNTKCNMNSFKKGHIPWNKGKRYKRKMAA